MKIILFLVLLFSFSTNAFAHGDTHSNNNSQFSMDTYLEKCGGEIYSDCPSQLEAVNAGLTHAKAIGSKILLVFGYDECPPCQWVNKIMKADKDKLKSFEKKYTIIKINSVLQEEEIKVEKMFSVEAPHYPSAFIIDPVTKSSQLNLPIHLAKSLTNLEEYLDATIAEQNKSIDEQIQSISSLGAASIELANKEIGLQLTDNKIKWVETDNKNFDDLVNQGIAYLHVFHYIDALRSFKAAEKLNNKSLYPKTGMILSYLSLSPSDSLPLLKKLLGDSIPLVDKATEREKMWFALAQSVFVFSTNASEKTYPNTLSPDEAFSQLLAKYPNDLEVLTLAAYQTRPDNAVELYKKFRNGL